MIFICEVIEICNKNHFKANLFIGSQLNIFTSLINLKAKEICNKNHFKANYEFSMKPSKTCVYFKEKY